MTHPSLRARAGERGITLLLTLVLIVAMLGMGFLAVYVSSSGIGLQTNISARQAAMNAAQAGLQHARLILAAVGTTNGYGTCTNGWTCVLQGRTHAKDDLPTSGNAKGVGAILYDGNNPIVDMPSPNGSSATTTLGQYTVWVRNDLADVTVAMANATPNTALLVDNNGIVVIRVVGKDKSGAAQVAIEAAATKVTTASTTVGANTVFGKNIDPYGSNAITGSFHF